MAIQSIGRGARQGAHEVGHHHHRTLEDAHQQQVLALVVTPDVGGQLIEPQADLRLGDKHAFEVGSQMGSVHGISLTSVHGYEHLCMGT